MGWDGRGVGGYGVGFAETTVGRVSGQSRKVGGLWLRQGIAGGAPGARVAEGSRGWSLRALRSIKAEAQLTVTVSPRQTAIGSGQ